MNEASRQKAKLYSTVTPASAAHWTMQMPHNYLSGRKIRTLLIIRHDSSANPCVATFHQS
jgi:hypothetical protein